MCLKLDEMEQDLVLACKHHYGSTGVEKVIGHYCAYNPEDVELGSKYHFVSELLLKLIGNGNLRLITLLDELSPRHLSGFGGMDQSLNAETKIYNRMVSMICGLEVQEQNKEGNYYILVDLHKLNEKFLDRFTCTSCGKECFTHNNYYPEVVFTDKDSCICEECSIDYEQVKGIIRLREKV